MRDIVEVAYLHSDSGSATAVRTDTHLPVFDVRCDENFVTVLLSGGETYRYPTARVVRVYARMMDAGDEEQE